MGLPHMGVGGIGRTDGVKVPFEQSCASNAPRNGDLGQEGRQLNERIGGRQVLGGSDFIWLTSSVRSDQIRIQIIPAWDGSGQGAPRSAACRNTGQP
jgi:hypothetical protein